MEHIQPSQMFYSYAMNNHWFTNYKAEQDGPTMFRYASCRTSSTIPLPRNGSASSEASRWWSCRPRTTRRARNRS